nr:MAG TPA: hypothetical protein [Caudoviricetes sp.]
MKLTDIFKFKLFERTDPVDMETVNENFESVEKVFDGLTAEDVGAVATKGNTADNTVAFTTASERKSLTSGETHATLFGKIAKWLVDLKAVAFSGSYKDLSDKPSIPPAVAVKGNAETNYRTGNVNLTPDNIGALAKTAVVNNNTTTEAGYALDARQANPNVDGSLAKQISALNDGLANKYFLKVLAKDWSGFVGTLFPQSNVQNDNVVDIYADKTDGTYPAVRVARASADYDGNNIPDTYLKKADAKNNVSSLSNTMTNYNDQTPVVQYFTVPDDGYYLVTGLVTFSSNANGFRETFITNTTSNYVMGRVRVPAISGSAVTLQVTSGGTFGPGQTGTLSTYQNSGSNLNVQEWLSMVKIAPKL